MRANALACGIAPTRSVVSFADIVPRHPDAGIRTTHVTGAPATAPFPAHWPTHVRRHDGSPATRTQLCAAPTTRRRLAALDNVGLQLRLSPGQSNAVRTNALACGVAWRESVVAFGDIAFAHQDARLRVRTDTSASTTAPTPEHWPMHVRAPRPSPRCRQPTRAP